MSQDLIGCRKRRKLKALNPRVVVFVNGPPSAEMFPVALKTVLGAGVKVNCRFSSSTTADEPPELSKGIIIR